MMDDKRLQEIKARAEAATPGPWECRINVGSRFYVNAPSYGVRDFCCLSGGFERREDAELTAHARTDIPDLIVEVERLRAENTRLRAELAAAKRDIRDMLYESCLLSDDALCSWCKKWSELDGMCWQNGLCLATSCKDECEWRGATENGGANGRVD